MTRSWLGLRQFDVAGAFAFNPAVTAFCIFGALYCAYAVAAVLLRTRRIRIEVTRPWEPTAIRIGAVSLLAINWLYLVAVGR
jgi:hypothetical protein